MPSSPSKILVLGIDAANPTLLREWAAAGVLPNIRSLMERGMAAETHGIDGFYVGATWPSFYTGVSPARHGLHYLAQLKPGTYNFYRTATTGLVQRDSLWATLSRAGRRVAVLDVPLSRIDSSLNGMQVVEWGGHDAVYGFQASSSGVEETIRSGFGDYPVGSNCDGSRRTAEDYRSFIDGLIQATRTKAELTGHFLRQGGWDFFIQVFTESHCVGHQCWHLHDASHPAHDPAIVADIGDPLERVYGAIDEAVGKVLQDAGDALVVVLAAHGMSYWYGAQFLLPEILFRLGAAYPAPVLRAERTPPSIAHRGAKWLRRRLATAVRNRMTPGQNRSRAAGAIGVRLPKIGVDPATSRCFVQKNGYPVGGIRLNLAGREPAGVLKLGADAERFVDELTADLLDIVDERTGKPLVTRVVKTAELYSGECLDSLPDLLVEWSDRIPTGSTRVGDGAGALVRASSPKIGVVEANNKYSRTGEHRPGGFFIAAGPTVPAGAPSRRISILDLAPTFASRLGVDFAGCDGRPIDELLGNRSRRS